MASNETDDEKLARELQEQFNAEEEAAKQEVAAAKVGPSPEEILKADMELAQKLMEEEENGATLQSTEKTNLDAKELSLLELQKKQQEEMDTIMALKLQQEMYAAEEFLNKPPPPKPQAYVPMPQFTRQKPEPNRLPPTPEAVKRITSDIKEVLTSKNRDLNVVPDEDDILHVQSLIIGPPDTPYANGFFHFDMIYPHDYPWRPPKVQLITTDSGRTRFNPNLYSNGKVCLSILGTWSGPGWTQIQTMLSTLLSIQSLMNSKPYHNEPGFEQERKPGDVEKYNQCIMHETIRVAVCGMMENPTCGNLFQEVMEEVFLEKYSEYEEICMRYGPELDGKPMDDPFGEKRGVFKYDSLLKRLKSIKEKLEAKKKDEEEGAKSEMDVETSVTEVPSAAMDTEKKEDIVIESQPMDTEIQNNTTMEQGNTTNLIESIMAAIAASKPTPSLDTNPQPSNLDFAKQIVGNLAAESSALLSADEEFAKMLQDQEYNEGGKFGYYGDYGQVPKNNTQPQYSPSTSYTPVKGPSLSELMAETTTEMKEKEDNDGIICLVCHAAPKEYIILPNCQQPHIYCMACAGKMVKQGPPVNKYNYNRRTSQKRTNGQSIQCVLCSSVSHLDPVGGLASLRRRKRRKTEGSKQQCEEHKEEFCMFCMDCVELVCYLCAGASHVRHNVEALDIAQNKLTTSLGTQMSTLEQKKGKLDSFVENVKKDRIKVTNASEAIQKESKAKFDELRKILDEKEKEMEEAIKKMEATKQGTLNGEITKAQQRVEKIDASIAIIQESLCEKTNLVFLQKMEDAEEQIRHACMTVDPEIKQRWFQMPPLNVQYVEQTLRSIKYKERVNQYGLYDQEEEVYSDDEEYQ